MATTAASRQPIAASLLVRGRARARRDARPAAAASSTVFGASLLIGLFGFASVVLVVARVFASWRISPGSRSHHVAIFGEAVAYPTANVGAIVVLILGAFGLVAMLALLHGAARELVDARRLQRRLSRSWPDVLPEVWVIDDPSPRAFCAGLWRPRVYVSTGTLALLGERELDVVLAHEHHHAQRRDPLRLATGRVLARGLFFLPALAALVSRQPGLTELGADEAAVVGAPTRRPALASAMLSFADAHPDRPHRSGGVDPARIDYLLGEPFAWRFPVAATLATVGTLGLLAAVAVLAGQAASGSASLSLPFVSVQPCVVTLALLPAALALAGVSFCRQRAQLALGR